MQGNAENSSLVLLSGELWAARWPSTSTDKSSVCTMERPPCIRISIMYNVSYTCVAEGHLWHCAPSRRRRSHEFIITRWCLRTWIFMLQPQYTLAYLLMCT